MKQKETRELYVWRLLISFIITTFVFIFVFSFAYYVSYLNYQGVSHNNNVINKALSDFDGYLLKSSHPAFCNGTILLESSVELDDIGSRIETLEKNFGANDQRVITQKQLYEEIEFKHYTLINNFNNICKSNFTTIIFFYSNNGDYKDASGHVGFIIGSFKSTNPDKIMVYSFDKNINFSKSDFFIKNYHILTVPFVILNNKSIGNVNNIKDLA